MDIMEAVSFKSVEPLNHFVIINSEAFGVGKTFERAFVRNGGFNGASLVFGVGVSIDKRGFEVSVSEPL